jgi:hypothetical protein
LAVAKRLTVNEVIERHGALRSKAEVAIVDIASTDRRHAVISALLVRNAGRTAILCALDAIPIDLVRDIHEFSRRIRASKRPLKTEVLFMEEAMRAFGDVSDIVAAFERDFLRPSG